MIDIDKLEKAVAKVVSVSVGDMLSELDGSLEGSTSGKVPAVVLERNFQKDGTHRKPNIPNYPYCSVTHNRIVDDVAELTDEFMDGDEYVYQTSKIVSVNIKFYGNRKNSVDSIANRMHMSCEVEHFRILLREYYGQAVAIRNKSDVVPTNMVYQDTYMELRSFDIFLSVVDEYRIPLSMVGYFDKIEFEADLPEYLYEGKVLGESGAESGTLENYPFHNLKAPIPPNSGLPAQNTTFGGQLDHYEDDPTPIPVSIEALKQ